LVRITIKMEVEEPGTGRVGPLVVEAAVDDDVAAAVDDIVAVGADDEVVADDVEEEDRPGTAMSLLSNDSDDDPTWAPAPDQVSIHLGSMLCFWKYFC
jgi:hypothetical protein